MNPVVSRSIGTVFWIVAVLGFGGWMFLDTDDSTPGPWTRVRVADGPVWTLADPTRRLRMGDAAFTRDEHNRWRQIGDVVAVRGRDDRSNWVELRTYELGATNLDSADWVVHQSSARLEDILGTLIPDQKRDELIRQMQGAFSDHGGEVMDVMMPILMQSMTASVPVVESALRASVRRHQSEIQALLQRHQQEIVLQRIVPLARNEVLPTLQRHGAAPAEAIGREIWNRASLWRFGWRAVYDQSPLPKRDMVQEEWRRFVDDEVIPIVESHVDEIVVVIQRTMMDLSTNPNLRDEIGAVLAELATDEPTRDLIGRIASETLLQNPDLREIWTQTWTSPQARAAMDLAGRRIEPVLRRIADEVLGTRDGGIEPGFARVLRNQILGKDRAWITLNPPRVDGGTVGSDGIRDGLRSLRLANNVEVYPIVRLATP
ncbi:MAG: hypothetical protein AAGJ40_19710 [Planctomycetota bacterium]